MRTAILAASTTLLWSTVAFADEADGGAAEASTSAPDASTSAPDASESVSPRAPASDTSPSARDRMALWPVLTPAGDAPAGGPLHKPLEGDGPLALRAQELEATLREAAQDLGFDVSVGEAAPAPSQLRDTDVLERSTHARDGSGRGTWIVSPRIEALGGDLFLVRIVVAQPNATELHVRVASVKGADVSVRGLVMLRDLLTASPAAEAASHERERERAGQLADLNATPPSRSQGRAILAVNGAALGAFLAFSVQRASAQNDANVDDPRVLLPLVTLGTGVGLGGSLLAAEEWDVTTGNAWYLAAGAWWGVASGFFISSATDQQPLNSRFLWGTGGGLVGLSLSITALTQGSIDDGGALLTHSGGAVGLLVGSAIELMTRGPSSCTNGPTQCPFDRPPPMGQGVGVAIGVIGAGFAATRWRVSPSRVLLLDLGAVVGALVGAAVTSPLVFDLSLDNARAFLGASLGGAALGVGAAAWLTRSMAAGAPSKPKTSSFGEPVFGPIGQSQTREGAVPVVGVGWRGAW